MAKFITVFNSKGGVGKTMLSMSLAGALAQLGKAVEVIDMDKQQDSVSWSGNALDPQNKPFPATVDGLYHLGTKFTNVIPQRADKYDYIIVDCPPSDESSVPYSSMMMSDLAIVPVTASPQDKNSVGRATSLIEEVLVRRPDLKHLFVITKYRKQNSVQRATAEEHREALGDKLWKSFISERTAYQEAMCIGGTVRDVKDASAAISEIDELTKTIIKLIS